MRTKTKSGLDAALDEINEIHSKDQAQAAKRVYIGGHVSSELKARLTAKARRERRSVAALIELILERELGIE